MLVLTYPAVIDIPRELELHPRVVEREDVPKGFFIVVQLPEPATNKQRHAIFVSSRKKQQRTATICSWRHHRAAPHCILTPKHHYRQIQATWGLYLQPGCGTIYSDMVKSNHLNCGSVIEAFIHTCTARARHPRCRLSIIATPTRPASFNVCSRESSGCHDVQSKTLALLGASNL